MMLCQFLEIHLRQRSVRRNSPPTAGDAQYTTEISRKFYTRMKLFAFSQNISIKSISQFTRCLEKIVTYSPSDINCKLATKPDSITSQTSLSFTFHLCNRTYNSSSRKMHLQRFPTHQEVTN